MEIIWRDGIPHVKRPTTAKEWVAAMAWAINWTLTSARLPQGNQLRRYARRSLLRSCLVGLGVLALSFALICLAVAH